jgi:hypothetical protein
MKMTSFFLFVLACSLFAGDAIQIGTSNSPLATAYNNSRKIARTYEDRRVVVYEDKEDGYDIVKLTYSDDGENWTEPMTFAYGYGPTIAVSKEGRFAVAWLSNTKDVPLFDTFWTDNMPTECYSEPPDTTQSQTTKKLISCSMDCGSPAWCHIAVHFIDKTDSLSKVYYFVPGKGGFGYNEDYDTSWPSPLPGEFPTVSCDLEYAEYCPAHIVWSDPSDKDSLLKYAVHNIEMFWPERQKNYTDFIFTLEKTEGYKCPSLSVRNFPNSYWGQWYWQSFIIGAFYDTRNNGMVLINLESAFDFWLSRFDPRNNNSVRSYHLPGIGPCFPSADDTIRPNRSCAVVWQQGRDIQYGQTFRYYLRNDKSTNLTEDDSAAIHFPNVCYKTFRATYFDMVWMEGDSAPYKIMYRRVPKDYSAIFDKLQILTTSVPNGTAGEDYSATLHYWLGREDYFSFDLLNGELPPGLTWQHSSSNEKSSIVGIPTQAGEYTFTICISVSEIISEDFTALSDTATYTIKIDYPTEIVNGDDDQRPTSFKLHSIYPNPFNSSAQITLSVPRVSRVQVMAYSIDGALVEEIVDTYFHPGRHTAHWNQSGLPSGTYLIKMQAENFVQTQKCLLLK